MKKVIRYILTLLFCIFFTSFLYASECPVPNEETKPRPDPAELTVQDGKDRDFQLYSASYALIIGQSGYINKSPLPEVIEEMKNIKGALEGQGFLVTSYYDLSSDKFRAAIDCFMHSSIALDPDARIIFIYSGHGETRKVVESNTTKSVGYILPIDVPASVDSPDFLAKSISFSQVLTWARELEVKHAMFIFDSCFSGNVLSSRGQEVPQSKPFEYIFSKSAQSKLRAFLTAGTAEQEVPAQSEFMKMITQAVLGQRREADSNRDGYLTGAELGVFIQNVVPTYVPTQTPSFGKIKDSELDLGELIFKLPFSAEETVATSSDEQEASLRPVFRGNSSLEGNSIGQEYIVEKIVSTKTVGCISDCSEESGSVINIKISAPQNILSKARLSAPELICQGCISSFRVTKNPVVADDGKTATVEVLSWERSAVWRFSAKLVAPRESGKVVVVNNVDNSTSDVSGNNLSVIAPASLAAGYKDVKVDAVVRNLASEVKLERRSARIELAKLIESSPELTAELIRGIPTGNYRYILGVADALAKSPSGWQTSESSSREILLNAQRSSRDKALKNSLGRALTNMRVSVYYEVGKDGRLTKDGQLIVHSSQYSKQPEFKNIKPGTILMAASEVYMRAGAGLNAGAIGVLPANACVRVVEQEKSLSTDVASNKGWFRVLQSSCR
ncbi:MULTISPECIES: caspase family protein [unclassified Pseudomonas]|jgi:hypothetical protein|uniref:caspase family protein n=1 Tax=unclassified Pseudomonas TaxID=196821 RepID=UPI001CBC1787|nr:MULTISPECIES: caspase family protein [unclassified Pseudomonas]